VERRLRDYWWWPLWDVRPKRCEPEYEQWYKTTNGYTVKKTKQTSKRKRRMYWINKYKCAKGCELCGYNAHGVALDFDHIDPSNKIFNVSSRFMNLSLVKIFEELRKCRVLCANCHRIHSYKSKHFRNFNGS
jgi:NAD-dependent dihydropyrimidine dehydrogenase PreA subunit